jgi:hypothetical protein
MAQNIVVALLVAACFVYALWTFAPKALRSRLATMLLKLPLPTFVQKPLTAAARQQGGCGCDGCDRSTVTKNLNTQGPAALDSKPGFQPLTFVRGRYVKKPPGG